LGPISNAKFRPPDRRSGSRVVSLWVKLVSIFYACFGIAALTLFGIATAHAQLVTTTAGRQQDLNFVANQLPQLDVNFFYQLDQGTYRR
jgi:hypothetical protein